jgi:transglutaminase superfamily protein
MRPAARDLIRARDVQGHDRLAMQAKIEAHRMAFLTACVRADATLRLRSFSKTVESIARRPRREAGVDAVCAAALAFRRMRPYYPRAYLCMFDSLALIHFLALRGLGADFVFGVDLTPFEAHCWVQCGDVVLNDDINVVRRYTPIMLV